jgi:hypothetical protein
MTHYALKSLMFLAIFGSLATFAAERFKYSELQIKDYDEMTTMVRAQIKKAQKLIKDTDGDQGEVADQESVETLRGALLLVLSRPNQDNMLAKLMPELRKELTGLSAFEDTLSSIAGEAMDGVKNKKLATVYRSTYHFVLENILSEFRPEVRDREETRKIFERIRDANIEVPKEVTKDLRLRSMFTIESPSERAKRILEAAKPAPAKK